MSSIPVGVDGSFTRHQAGQYCPLCRSLQDGYLSVIIQDHKPIPTVTTGSPYFPVCVFLIVNENTISWDDGNPFGTTSRASYRTADWLVTHSFERG